MTLCAIRTSSLKRWAPRSLVAGLVAGIFLLGAASPAEAGHESNRPVKKNNPKFVFKVEAGPGTIHRGPTQGRHAGHVHRNHVQVDYRAVEFNRGYQRGSRAGYSAGYTEGMNGQIFCDQVPAPRRSTSVAFRRGFKKGFAAAYVKGFNQGRAKRRSTRHHRRWWW